MFNKNLLAFFLFGAHSLGYRTNAPAARPRAALRPEGRACVLCISCPMHVLCQHAGL